jgi:hypothetical protein
VKRRLARSSVQIRAVAKTHWSAGSEDFAPLTDPRGHDRSSCHGMSTIVPVA